MLKQMKTITITKKGQISIPKEMREITGFKIGSKIVVVTFKDHIELRPIEQFETALLSEKALAEHWLTPEEDEAWKDL